MSVEGSGLVNLQPSWVLLGLESQPYSTFLQDTCKSILMLYFIHCWTENFSFLKQILEHIQLIKEKVVFKYHISKLDLHSVVSKKSQELTLNVQTLSRLTIFFLNQLIWIMHHDSILYFVIETEQEWRVFINIYDIICMVVFLEFNFID